MSNFRDRFWLSMAARDEAAKGAYEFNDKLFKFASWFLTLGAIKLAAEITHSRALNFAAIFLTGAFWLPIANFIVNLQWRILESRRDLAILAFKLVLIGVMGAWVNARVNKIVDAIVAEHIVAKKPVE